MTTAKIIADSISESGIRITTMELEFERFLLAQFNTHRMFSRSAQSSRAVPVQKMIDALNSNATPVFMKNKSGMQSNEIISDCDMFYAKEAWNVVKNAVISGATVLDHHHVHKQWINRLLEPFSTVKVVVTATEWDNFFALRLHHAAQPEMQELAQAMKTAMDESMPELLSNGEWHAPYLNQNEFNGDFSVEDLLLISAARCARVSYLNHDNSKPDIEKDLDLAQRLLADKHLSPFEHQAKPMRHAKHSFNSGFGDLLYQEGATHVSKDINRFSFAWSGNFKGWIQHRQSVDL
jgi:thymidylate synthase ThyX